MKFVISAGIIGALAGAVISHFVHPRWVASMTVQIGQVTEMNGEKMDSQRIENPLTVIDRVNLPAFRLQVIKDLGLSSPDNARDSKEIFDSLNATPETSPDLIHLQVSALSHEQADAALRSAFDELSTAHRQLYGPPIDNMKRQLGDTSKKLVAAEADYERAYQTIRSSTQQSAAALDNARSVLVTNMATQINQQILQLKRQATELQQGMSPMNTYPTRIVEAPYAPQQPRSPSMKLLIAAGAVLGLLAGAALALGAGAKRA